MSETAGSEDFVNPGVRLGMPADGPGSVASWPRRVFALAIDWIIAQLSIAAFVGGDFFSGSGAAPFLPLAAFFAEVAIMSGLIGGSIGQRLLSVGVARLDGNPLGLARAAVRTFLICLVIPPVVYNRDRRGLHDLAVGTIAVRL